MEFNNSNCILLFFLNADNDHLKLSMWSVFAVITLFIYDAGLNGVLYAYAVDCHI